MPYRQRAALLVFWNLQPGPEKKGYSKHEKWQMCLKVDGGLHGGVSGAGRGLCAFSPGFQGGVGMEIGTVVRGREVLRNL